MDISHIVLTIRGLLSRQLWCLTPYERKQKADMNESCRPSVFPSKPAELFAAHHLTAFVLLPLQDLHDLCTDCLGNKWYQRITELPVGLSV